MARFMMVQVHAEPYPGTAYLNRAVTQRGHSFGLILTANPRVLLKRIAAEKPDLIGFSCMTCFYKPVREFAQAIKREFSIPIILGGVHPTFFPDVIHEDAFDMICRGEGEFALPELLDAIASGSDFTQIQNLWVKRNGTIFKNELRPLIEPLDEVPLIDWSCYQGTSVRHWAPLAYPIRGCAYNCSYCFNEPARRLYHGLGTYIRYFSVERTIAEVQEALRFFANSPLVFEADSFGLDLDWMGRMLDAYSAATDRPFFLLLRPELVTDACADILARHRCCGVGFGVESGSERVRREILNRHYSNEQLLKAAARLHGRGIKFGTYNILGIPTETEDELWETIDINVRMKTDFPRGMIFIPMPQTKLFDYSMKEGYLDADFSFDQVPRSAYVTTVLKNVDKNRIENSLYFFITAIKIPKLRNVIRWLTHTKSNFLYRWGFYLVYAYIYRKSQQPNILSYTRFLFANRHTK